MVPGGFDGAPAAGGGSTFISGGGGRPGGGGRRGARGAFQRLELGQNGADLRDLAGIGSQVAPLEVSLGRLVVLVRLGHQAGDGSRGRRGRPGRGGRDRHRRAEQGGERLDQGGFH